MNAAILGSRERRITHGDKQHVEQLVTRLLFDYGTALVVHTVGCDLGIGRMVLDACESASVRMFEFRVKAYGGENWNELGSAMSAFLATEIWKAFNARNHAALYACDLFHFYLGPKPDGILERLVPDAIEKVGESRVFTYPEGRR